MVQEREGSPTKPGWAEPRTTARPPCSVNHLGHHAGAHTTRTNHDGAHTTHEAHPTRDHQRNALCARATHGVVQLRGWMAGKAFGGVRHLGLAHTKTWGGRWWTTAERRCVGSKNRQTTLAATSTNPIHQLLGTANAQTAPTATSTAPAHQRRRSFSQRNMTFTKEARNWRPILGTETFFWHLNPPPPSGGGLPPSNGLLPNRHLSSCRARPSCGHSHAQAWPSPQRKKAGQRHTAGLSTTIPWARHHHPMPCPLRSTLLPR